MRDLDPATQERIKAERRALRSAGKEILDTLEYKLPPEVVSSLRRFHHIGESGHLLDELVATVVRRAIPLNLVERDLLARTLDVTGSAPPTIFTFLADRKGVLAAITTLADDGTVTPPWPGFDPSAWWPRPRAASLWGHKGGHLHGIGIPHKTTFPRTWDAQRILDQTADIARNPDEVPVRDRNGGWITRGTRDNVSIESRLRPDGTIGNAYPLSGLGIHRNDTDGLPQPLDGFGAPATGTPDPAREQDRARLNDLHDRTAALVDALAGRLPDADSDRIRTDLGVGEWLIALDDLSAALVQDRIAISAVERDDIAAAVRIGGLGDDDLPVLRDPDEMLAALTVEG